MGAQIGCEYALSGHDVVLHSRDADAAHARAKAGLDLVERHQLRSTEDVRRARARVKASPDTAAAADGADLLVVDVTAANGNLHVVSDVLTGLA